MEELFKALPKLTPEVSLPAIFLMAFLWLIRYMGELHRQKSLEFTATLKNIEDQHSKSYEKVSSSIDANTQATQQMREATQQMSQTLTQLIIQRK